VKYFSVLADDTSDNVHVDTSACLYVLSKTMRFMKNFYEVLADCMLTNLSQLGLNLKFGKDTNTEPAAKALPTEVWRHEGGTTVHLFRLAIRYTLLQPSV